MPYIKQVWSDEVPSVTPVRYKISEVSDGDITPDAKIEVITPLTAGSPVSAERLNYMEEGIETAQETAESALAKAENTMGVILRILSSQNIAPSSEVNLLFTSSQVVTDAMWSISNPSRIYIPHNGVYLITLQIGWSGHATGTRTIRLWQNGAAQEFFSDQVSSPSSSPFGQKIVDSFYLEGGPTRYVEARLSQNSGTTLTATARMTLFNLGKY